MATITPMAGLVIPKLNQVWPGQGGRFMGLHPLGGYLIAATDFLEKRHAFGIYGKQFKGFSDIDGAENTAKLINLGSPAAQAAAEYTADGHSDFYLLSHRELMQVFAVQGPVKNGPTVISSTPCGSDHAWALGFEYGLCRPWYRHVELAVLPVRRFIPFNP